MLWISVTVPYFAKILWTAFLRKISLRLGNRLLSYGQKRFSIWRPYAILNSKENHIWSRDCHRVQNLLLCTKFHQNQSIFCWDMAIYWFSRWRLSAVLNLWNLVWMSHDLCRHAILLPYAKFHCNCTISCCVMIKNRFPIWRPCAILNF